MNCNDYIQRLHPYIDAELGPTEANALAAHLAACPKCRAQLESLQSLRRRTQALPREIPPASDLWAGISAALAERAAVPPLPVVPAPRQTGPSAAPIRRSPLLGWFVPLAVAASVALMARFAERSIPFRPALPGWSVAAVEGAPRVNRTAVRHQASFHVGQWLETDAASRAKVTVGEIGQVNVEPNSRLRLAAAAAHDHRLELARGTMSAFIYAPPRLFFVDTPSATAVDLGCAYTLKVDDDGNGELEVSSGYVALEAGEHEAIIRSGMMCLTRRGVGPGTPFAVDAPPELRAALTRFDFERGAATSALADVLRHARGEDTITLWHLLARTRDEQRVAVFDALAQRSAPPPDVTREGILSGDASMRKAWGTALGIDRF